LHPGPLTKMRSAWKHRVRRALRAQRRFSFCNGKRGPAVGYLGYVGYDNFGDDIMFSTIAQQLCPTLSWRIADLRPFPVSLFASDSAGASLRAVALGGGTLIYRNAYLDLAERAMADGKPLIIAGSGAADTDYWSAVLPEYDSVDLVRRWNRVLRGAQHVGVRGPRSRQMIAASGGPDAVIVGDPALYVSRNTPFRRPPLGVIGVNLGSHDQPWGDQESIVAAVGKAIKHLSRQGYKIQFIAMSKIDEQNARALASHLDGCPISIHTSRNIELATLGAIRDCDLVIGQRLHSIVLACAFGVPSISLSYQPKALDFLESVGLLRLSMRTDSLDVTRLIELSEELLGSGGEAVRRQLSDSVSNFHAVQEKFFGNICASLATEV
jgi:polysaccharide pyruvyl transferase WcaK-like protein